jgi:hypothetical protein
LDSLTSPFTIDSCVLGIFSNIISDSKLKITDVVPNPVNHEAKIKIENSYEEEFQSDIQLFNEKGQRIVNLLNASIPVGTSEFGIKINNTAQGNYFIVLKTKKGESVFPVKIMN